MGCGASSEEDGTEGPLIAAAADLVKDLGKKIVGGPSTATPADTTPMADPESITVHVPSEKAETGRVVLSPFDFASAGRPVPMLWFYEATVNTSQLVSALELTLTSYQVLAGRYAVPPDAVELNNHGVPVEICENTSTSATDAASAYLPSDAEYKIFARNSNSTYLPSADIHAKMDPDKFDPAVPLLAIKITQFVKGGTAIGILLMHAVCDAHAMITFMKNWSRCFREMPMDPPPIHERCPVQVYGEKPELQQPTTMKMRCVAPGEPVVPEFAPKMPMILGQSVCGFNFTKANVDDMVAAAKSQAADKLSDGRFFSTDDVLTAHIWKAMVKLRCHQLDLSEESDELSTAQRACNFRSRCTPPLGDGYCANGVTQVWTEMSVKDILTADIATIALKLRENLQKFTADSVPDYGQWMGQKQKEGFKVVPVFDSLALTFVISSWNFPWYDVDFHQEPMRFDHAALVPIVVTLVPRPKKDGFMLYAQGTEESMVRLAEYLKGAL